MTRRKKVVSVLLTVLTCLLVPTLFVWFPMYVSRREEFSAVFVVFMLLPLHLVCVFAEGWSGARIIEMLMVALVAGGLAYYGYEKYHGFLNVIPLTVVAVLSVIMPFLQSAETQAEKESEQSN